MQIACHLNSYYSEISVSDIASDWSSNRHIIRLVADRYKSSVASRTYHPTGCQTGTYPQVTRDLLYYIYIYTCNANRVPLVR